MVLISLLSLSSLSTTMKSMLKICYCLLLITQALATPVLASSPNYRCDFGNTSDFKNVSTALRSTATVTCRQNSKEIGPSSSDGAAPRDLLYDFNINIFPEKMVVFGRVFDTSVINGKYGILARDKVVVDDVNTVRKTKIK